MIHPDIKQIIDSIGVDAFIAEIRPIIKERGFVIKRMDPVLRKRKSKFNNSGEAWTTTEEAALIAEFESGLSIWKITPIHERSPTSLLTRLASKGLVVYDKNQKGWVTLKGAIYATYHDVKVFEKDQPNIKKPKID